MEKSEKMDVGIRLKTVWKREAFLKGIANRIEQDIDNFYQSLSQEERDITGHIDLGDVLPYYYCKHEEP